MNSINLIFIVIFSFALIQDQTFIEKRVHYRCTDIEPAAKRSHLKGTVQRSSRFPGQGNSYTGKAQRSAQ